MTMNHNDPPRGTRCVPYILLILAMGVLVYLVASSDAGGAPKPLPAPQPNAVTVTEVRP